MAKVGRNDPCPCGSGKKYKKCHGSLRDTTAARRFYPVAQEATIPAKLPPTISAQLPPQGLAGIQQALVVVPVFTDPKDPRNQGGPQGRPGAYEVIFTLCRPGFPLTQEREARFADGLSGDSHLAISKPAFTPPDPGADRIKIRTIIEGEAFEFTGLPNAKGFLGKIVTNCQAQNFLDAYRKSYSALAPSLSNWSIHLDVPLSIYQVDIKEVRTGTVRMTFMPPFLETPFAVMPHGQMPADFRGYASMYRESLSSNSPVYQFLCHFKIIESIRVRRARLGEEARKFGRPFVQPQEVFPNDAESLRAWLDTIFALRPPTWDDMTVDSLLLPEIAGRRFGAIFESFLQPLRVEIAHALFELGELKASFDDGFTNERVNRWLPVIKCIARRMLRNEFPKEFLPYVPDGTQMNIGDAQR